jgi:hypothetical protein
MLHAILWGTSILVQQGPLLCLHGSHETVLRNLRYDINPMVDSDSGPNKWRCIGGRAVEEDERWESGMPFSGQNGHDSKSSGTPADQFRGSLLTSEAIFRLAIPLVDSIHKPTSNAWPHLHNPQRITQIRPNHRVGDDVLWLHIHVPQNGDRST